MSIRILGGLNLTSSCIVLEECRKMNFVVYFILPMLLVTMCKKPVPKLFTVLLQYKLGLRETREEYCNRVFASYSQNDLTKYTYPFHNHDKVHNEYPYSLFHVKHYQQEPRKYTYQWCANPSISNPNPDPNPGTLNPNPAESESTLIFLNPNPNPNPIASNPNPDSNPVGHRRP